MVSKHFSNCFLFSSASLPLTKISTGTLPPFKGSRYEADKHVSAAGLVMAAYLRREAEAARVFVLRILEKRRKRTFLLGSDDLEEVGGDDEQGRGELVA